MIPLFTLVHRDKGPLARYENAVEAGAEMARLVVDGNESLDDLLIEVRESVASDDMVPHAE